MAPFDHRAGKPLSRNYWPQELTRFLPPGSHALIERCIKTKRLKKADLQFASPNCVLKISDPGIAVGPEIKNMQIHTLDSRICTRPGFVVIRAGYPMGCGVTQGIPLRALEKHLIPYPDRALILFSRTGLTLTRSVVSQGINTGITIQATYPRMLAIPIIPVSRLQGEVESGHMNWRGLNGRFLLFVALMTIALFSGEALALPPGPHGGASHFGQGIPVFWPYHAGLMIAGFLLLLTGFFVARYHKTKNWSRTHAVLQVCGAACVIAGITVGVYMVALSGLPSLVNIHEILGAATGLLILVTLVLGYSFQRITHAKNTVRQGHRWLGRIVICLMALTMIFGIYFLSLLLER